MKRIVLLVFGLLASCLMGFAQTHWTSSKPGSDAYNLVGYITIDGEENTSNQIEIGTFIVSSTNPEAQPGTCVGADWDLVAENPSEWDGHMLYVVTFYGTVGDVVTFKLYDHASNQELELNCEVNATLSENMGCIGCEFDEEHYFVFSFTTPTPQPTVYPLPITGYGENAGGYYLIASPVTVAPADVAGDPQGMTEGNFDLYYFDNSKEQEWINYIMDQNGTINSDFGPLTPGKGYLYAREEDAELELSGELYDGDGQFDLAYSTGNPSADMRGWNLVGNPFTYGATVDKVAFYVMNEEGRNDIIVSEETAIAPMQGIFVLATAEGQTVKFSQALQPLVDGKVVLNLNRNRGTVIDRAIVRLGEGGTLPKFMLNPENTKIYIEQGGDDYAMVSSNEDEIPVCFKAASNGTYTLNVAVQNAELDYLHLVDNLAGTDTDLLANPNYTFEANTGDYASRFTLVLRNTTGLVEHFAFFNGHNWTVSNQGEATLQVIDVTGRLVSTKTIDGTTQLDINAAPGVYMFRLVNGSDVKVQKVVVR